MTDIFDGAKIGLQQRRRKESTFQWAGRIAIIISLAFLVAMVGSIFLTGKSAVYQTKLALTVDLGPDAVDPNDIDGASFDTIVKTALRAEFPDVSDRKERRALNGLVSPDAGFEVKKAIEEDPSLLGGPATIWVTASDEVDMVEKGNVDLTIEEKRRKIKDYELAWIGHLKDTGALEEQFNKKFFTGGDSREPELAGILGAFVGSFFSLLVCFSISFPLGIFSAIYLEEFAPKNRISDFVEVNINNLAAVPSIVFGLLGLAIFLNTFGLPRSSPLVGGMVLSLMTLPTIIIAARASLRAVPPSIREAALGLGASPVQMVFHHTLPLAMPGILTGSILGMAQALGETAPLLMIGMVAFIVDIPTSILEPATALPVQIFLWADSPERAFLEKTSAAIIVLLFFLIMMNIIAVILRKKFEIRY
ncbi:MAG: phosphate ABC transporter permease PstA [Marinosulfonomonas sp.]